MASKNFVYLWNNHIGVLKFKPLNIAEKKPV